MAELIQQSFRHVGGEMGMHVRNGYYDVVGPNGKVIPHTLWDELIQPGWNITMLMPTPAEHDPGIPAPPPPPPNFDGKATTANNQLPGIGSNLAVTVVNFDKTSQF